MGADKNKKIAIYTQLLDLYKKQDEQLKRFTEYVDDLIEKRAEMYSIRGMMLILKKSKILKKN